MEEEWRAIPGWEGGYEVSSLGRLKSLARQVAANPRGLGLCWIERREKILPGYPHRNGGYLCVTLNFKGIRKTMALIAPLVAAAFLGPRPEGLLVCHNNGDPQDNRVGNLRYDTPKGNAADVVKHGRMKARSGEGHCRTKLTVEDVRTIRAAYKGRKDRFRPGHIQQKDLMARYGLSRHGLQAILYGKTWKSA